MPVKKGAAWEEERNTGRKYSGAYSDKQSEPGERQQFWVSGYTRKDGKKVESHYKQNPSFKGESS